MPLRHFQWQMEYLARHRAVVPLQAILDGSVPEGRPAVAITFDDGYRSVLTEAVPVLRRYGFPATAFVPTKWIGDRNRWDGFPDNAIALELMTADELLEADRAGVEIASHSHAHAKLDELSEHEARADLEASVALLREILGRPPRYLAYPYGRHGRTTARAAASARFIAAFSIGQLSTGRYGLERVTIRPTDGRFLFALKTSGRYLAWRMCRPLQAGYPSVRWILQLRRRMS
jgi:peptidoglycan/xylan/chitin deacetylase (PgdA/CDA1 family)